MITKQVSIKEYRKCRYKSGSAPDPRTVRKWIENGNILGGRRASGKYYVELGMDGKELSQEEVELLTHD